MGKIVHLSAGEGKMELWSKDEMVFATGKASELAKAYLKYGCEETIGTASSVAFGRESGVRNKDDVKKLCVRTLKQMHKY